jgi:putative component of toxin-antitoxin plasmid stabilization module
VAAPVPERTLDVTSPATAWTPEIYTDENGNSPYETFIESLDDATFAALDAAIEHVLRRNGIDLCRTEWMKPLGHGLYEFRIRHDADEILARFGEESSGSLPKNVPILLRVFCYFYGSKVVLLLSGYDKGSDPSGKRQQKEIAQARKHLTAWLEAKKHAAAQGRRGR